MREGYRETSKTFVGATLSVDAGSKRLGDEIDTKGIKKVFCYPVNGLPKIQHKPSRRPA